MITCKGYCDRLQSKKPQTMPYLTHAYCRLCCLWISHEDAWKSIRCPCCHGRLSFKPRENSKKKKYRGMLK